MRSNSTRWAAAALLAATATAAGAQSTLGPSAFDDEVVPNYNPRRSGPPPPAIRLEIEREIVVPGPLAGTAPVVRADGSIALRGRDTEIAIPEGGTPTVTPRSPEAAVAAASADPWVYAAPGGRRRYRAFPDGRLVGERRCFLARDGWWRSWKIRVGAATPARPILFGRSLFFGAWDNRVYALRARNGHRLWATDVGDRVSLSLASWTGQVLPPGASEPRTVHLVLVVPDGSQGLLALDPFDGRRLTSLQPAQEAARFATAPGVTPDGRILVGVQGYAPGDARVVFVRVVPAQPPSRGKPAHGTP